MQTTSSYLCVVCLLGHKQTNDINGLELFEYVTFYKRRTCFRTAGCFLQLSSVVISLCISAHFIRVDKLAGQQPSVSVRNRQASRIMQWLYVAPPLGWLFYNNLQLNCLHLTTDKCHCPFSLFTTKRSTGVDARWTTMKTRAYRKSRGRFWRCCLHTRSWMQHSLMRQHLTNRQCPFSADLPIMARNAPPCGGGVRVFNQTTSYFFSGSIQSKTDNDYTCGQKWLSGIPTVL